MRPVAIALALVPLLHAQDPANASASADALRATVRGAIAWIERQAVPVPGVEDAVLFPSAAGGKPTPQTIVYGGSAGVLIFLENAAAVLDDTAARKLADRTAKGLRSARHVDSREHATWTKGSMMGTTGLYTGDAGVGQAFLVRHALRGDPDALATATEIGDALLLRATDDDGNLSWGKQADIIFGNAGTALFLLELAQAGKQQRFADAARRSGHGLLAAAERVPSTANAERKLPIWTFQIGAKGMHMPNFSHGTAGVAYALARLGRELGDEELLRGARDGAEWLLEHAVTDGDGLKWAANDAPPARYMGGWCHGPAGTGRLFLLLASITGEARYREAAQKGGRFIVAYAADAEKQGQDGQPPYVPPSYCCGVAGVVEYFCDLYRTTGDAKDAAFARKAGQYLLDVAIADGDGRKWKNGQSVPGGPVAASSTGFNIDLMLGAAGESLALLHLLLLDRDVDPVRGMPDRAVTAHSPNK